MDVTCPNCGATNRNTSRFCARCGELLHRNTEQGTGAGEGALDLPWLQTVQDRALKPKTERLTDAQPIQTPPPPQSVPAQPVGQASSMQDRPAPPEAGTPPNGDQAAPGPGPVSEQPAPERDPNEAPPQWVVSILEPTATPPSGQEQTYEPEELEHIMPWVHGQQPAATQGSEPPDASGLPPWLSDITVQETLQGSTGVSHEQRAPLPSEFELEGIEPFVPPMLPEDEVGGAHTPGRAGPQEQVPLWLRSITGQGEPEPAEAPERMTSLPLMPTEVTSPVEAPLAREIPVLPPRAGAVETLASLIGAPGMSGVAGVASRPRQVSQEEMHGQGPIAAEATKARTGMTRLLPDGIIYLAILGVLLAMLIVKPDLGNITAPSAPGVQSFYNAIEDVRGRPLIQERIVLVAYDWDATRSAEMSLLAESVMRHLMARNIRFITVSTNPQGPGFAQLITSKLREEYTSYVYGRDYLVMGYLPGSQAALGALVANFSDNVPIDYEQNRRLRDHPIGHSDSLTAGNKLLSFNDFALVIALTSEEAELRNWVEQVGARTDRTIVAAVPQSMDPLARPYLGIKPAGLTALISGPMGAFQYTKQLESQGVSVGKAGSIQLSDRLNAQSAAQLLVALVIIAALIGAATRRVVKR